MKNSFNLREFIFKTDPFIKKRVKNRIKTEWETHEEKFFKRVFHMTVMRYYIRYFRKISMKSKLEVSQMIRDEKERFFKEKEEVLFIKYLLKNKI